MNKKRKKKTKKNLKHKLLKKAEEESRKIGENSSDAGVISPKKISEA